MKKRVKGFVVLGFGELVRVSLLPELAVGKGKECLPCVIEYEVPKRKKVKR